MVKTNVDFPSEGDRCQVRTLAQSTDSLTKMQRSSEVRTDMLSQGKAMAAVWIVIFRRRPPRCFPALADARRLVAANTKRGYGFYGVR